MEHLFDTCTLLGELMPSNIIDICQKIKSKNEIISITEIIKDELMPHENLTEEKREISRGVIHSIEFCEKTKTIGYIEINSNSKFKKNLDDIRKRYYSHISLRELKEKVKSGEMDVKEMRALVKKDLGECSCIAVAITDPEKYVIVSEDEGKVCKRPEINIFNIYRAKNNIKVYTYNDWQNVYI